MLYFISSTDEFNSYICVLEKNQHTWKCQCVWPLVICLLHLWHHSFVSVLFFCLGPQGNRGVDLYWSKDERKFFSQMNSLDPNQLWNLLDGNADFYDNFPCLASVCYFLMLLICKRCTTNVPFHGIFN